MLAQGGLLPSGPAIAGEQEPVTRADSGPAAAVAATRSSSGFVHVQPTGMHAALAALAALQQAASVHLSSSLAAAHGATAVVPATIAGEAAAAAMLSLRAVRSKSLEETQGECDPPPSAMGSALGDGDDSTRPAKQVPKRPPGQQCPRCNSLDTKFCYYNNYNVKQPRYYCRDCQRYWTIGGALRSIAPGAGRKRSKANSGRAGAEAGSGDHEGGGADSAAEGLGTSAGGGSSGAAMGEPGAALAPSHMTLRQRDAELQLQQQQQLHAHMHLHTLAQLADTQAAASDVVLSQLQQQLLLAAALQQPGSTASSNLLSSQQAAAAARQTGPALGALMPALLPVAGAAGLLVSPPPWQPWMAMAAASGLTDPVCASALQAAAAATAAGLLPANLDIAAAAAAAAAPGGPAAAAAAAVAALGLMCPGMMPGFVAPTLPQLQPGQQLHAQHEAPLQSVPERPLLAQQVRQAEEAQQQGAAGDHHPHNPPSQAATAAREGGQATEAAETAVMGVSQSNGAPTAPLLQQQQQQQQREALAVLQAQWAALAAAAPPPPLF